MSLQQFSDDLRNNRLTPAEKLASFHFFAQYFDTLKVAALGPRRYTDKQLSQHLFKNCWNENFERLVFEKHLFAANNTIQRLNRRITADNFFQYEYLLITLSYDLFELVKYTEVNILHNTLSFSMGSRPDQNAREIFDVSRLMLEIGTVIPSNLYLREIFPVSVFLLRQTIEIYGKRMLGFYSITNKQMQRVRGVSTQVAWEFIKKETLRSNCRITLPTDIDIIKKIEEWTNYYVHSGDIPEIYLIENAINMISPIIYPQNSTEKNYNNTIVFSGTSKIKDYESVKKDFEAFVNQKQMSPGRRIWDSFLIKIRMKKSNERIVNWKDVKLVDSTIININ